MNNINPRKIILALILVALAAVFAFALDDGYIQRDIVPGNGIKIGSDGTWTQLMHVGYVTLDSADTSTTVALTSVSVGDIAIVTPDDSLTTATKYFAECTTGSLRIQTNAAPGADVRFNYIVIGKP